MSEEFSRRDLQALAAAVAERIIGDPALRELLTGQPGVGQVCPPRKLCCFQGYACESPFVCQKDFRCPHGFNSVPGDLYPY